jgi:hypothetical protein
MRVRLKQRVTPAIEAMVGESPGNDLLAAHLHTAGKVPRSRGESQCKIFLSCDPVPTVNTLWLWIAFVQSGAMDSQLGLFAWRRSASALASLSSRTICQSATPQSSTTRCLQDPQRYSRISRPVNVFLSSRCMASPHLGQSGSQAKPGMGMEKWKAEAQASLFLQERMWSRWEPRLAIGAKVGRTGAGFRDQPLSSHPWILFP